jgi:large subunit ribosomal protein L25
MTKISLQAGKRKVTGRKVKNLRKGGVLPANIYGRDVKSVAIEINSREFREVFKKAGETGIVEVALAKETRPVLIHNVQVHPATGEILHVDFLQVNLKEKVSAQIPVELVGESPAEKSGVGTAVLLVQELEVEALPGDMIPKFEIDATKLTEVDQVVKISDLKYDSKKIEVKADLETIVAKVEPPQKEEVIQPAEPVVEETQEGTQEAKPETENEIPKDQAPSEQK